MNDPIWILLAVCAVALGVLGWLWPRKPAPLPLPVPTTQPPEPVDPWHLQRMLMMMSDQSTPPRPEINKDVLLYYGLCVEELAEFGTALEATLVRARWARAGLDSTRWVYLERMGEITLLMQKAAEEMKTALKYVEPFNPLIPLRAESRELLDGTTDLAVVNSGMSIAAGFVGEVAYQRTVTSNISKANPDTGKIDKTPDGKWIKGRNFKLAELDDLI